MLTITSGIGNLFSIPPEARENMARIARENAINSAIRSLTEIEDPAVQQIVAQLKTLYDG